ncbi:hypothetical protein HDU84_000168 [Entophlyctis sp. JEL0112]|nr:hypothetical protein HDU84_000168 [Entophlyctis sp. JEL0112]
MDPAAVTRVSVFLPFMVGQQLDNANTYNQVAPRLISCAEAAGISATFISIDLPGHGKSEHFGLEGTYFPWDYALAVLDVSVSLKWPKFTLIGHSMGGHIALLFAGIYPEMLENLVIIESVGYVNRLGDVKDDASALRTFISRRRSFTTDKSQQERSTYSSAEEAAKVRMNGATTVSFEAAMTLCERGLVSTAEGKFSWSFDKRLYLRHVFRWDHESIEAILRKITCRALFLFGSSSSILSPDDALLKQRIAILSDRTGESSVTWIENGTHHLHLEKETAVIAVARIAQFLLSVQSVTSSYTSKE